MEHYGSIRGRTALDLVSTALHMITRLANAPIRHCQKCEPLHLSPSAGTQSAASHVPPTQPVVDADRTMSSSKPYSLHDDHDKQTRGCDRRPRHCLDALCTLKHELVRAQDQVLAYRSQIAPLIARWSTLIPTISRIAADYLRRPSYP
jgi:hypothetical protein